MTHALWWERDDLHYRNRHLIFAGEDVFELAGTSDTPSFFYSVAWILAIESRRSATYI